MQLTKRVLTVGKLLRGSDQDSRYLYSKLRIDPEKKYAECTNGHWLVRVPLESLPADDLPVGYQEVKDPIYLDHDQTQDLLKRIPRNPTLPILKFQRCVGFEKENGNTRISFSADTDGNALTIGMETDPGNWAPTDKVIPEGKPKARFSLSPTYLLDLIRACQSGDRLSPGMVTFEFFGDEKPVNLRFSGNTDHGKPKETLAVLMPMRGPDKE